MPAFQVNGSRQYDLCSRDLAHKGTDWPWLSLTHSEDDTVNLVVGVLARFEAKPGLEAEVIRFFENGLAVVHKQPPSTSWFAFRIDQTTYGAFAAFASDEDRSDLLSTGGPLSAQKHAELFARPPTFELVDLLETRQGAIGHS
jgi:hypothetical protein